LSTFEPGLNRHDWLEETGHDVNDPVFREGKEREIVAEFLAADEIKGAYERVSEELSPRDIAAAVNGYRAIFDYLVSSRSMADEDITMSGEPEA
jgi:hypothetical protein